MLTPRHSEVDITNHTQLHQYLVDHRPAVIVNAAAYTKVDDCETNRAVALRVNGEAPGYMAEAAQLIGAKLVHYSTDYVFSGGQANGYGESDVPDQPVNAYGESKLAGEQAIQQQTNHYVIIRTAWLYGHGGQNFVDTMLRLGWEKSELKVVNDQHGSPTYTVDLAAATAALLADDRLTGIFHLTNARSCTWYEFALEIFRLAQLRVNVLPCTTADYPRPAKRPAYSILLNTKRPALRSWQAALAAYLLASTDQV